MEGARSEECTGWENFAGAAAALKSLHPDMNAADAKSLLTGTRQAGCLSQALRQLSKVDDSRSYDVLEIACIN